MSRFVQFLFLALCPVLSLTADPVASKPPHIVLVGDSTVTDHDGWGLGFRQFVNDGATVSNTARNGRSSKSFTAEGHWAEALALKGDYYLIQFGHNDQPGKGPDRETDPTTTYTQNMARYVEDVRSIGAVPILVTSLVRRDFSKTEPSRIADTLAPYVEAVRKLAAEKNVPLIDLHASSLALCETLGPVASAKFDEIKDGKPDTTHLMSAGSVVFARLIVEELRRVVPALAPVLLTEPRAAKITDLEYGQAGGEKLLLDVCVPAGDGPFPIAILVHGGGWSRGDKSGFDEPTKGGDVTTWFAPLTAAKFTWFSINYRHAPKNRWPACFEDVQTAIRWVKAHAANYNGDPSRIALFGHSAGGHLVCLAATLVDDSVRVQAVVGYAPVTNHEQDLPVRGGLSPSLQGLLNRPKEITPESLGILREISPLNHLRPGLPPFLLVHGDGDKTVPIEQSKDFQMRLQAAGVPCELMIIPGAGHGLLNWDQFAPGYADRVMDWLRHTLPPPGLP